MVRRSFRIRCIRICRWMDGSLLDLTAEMVESELEDYWHELFKVQKLLVTKLKKAKVDTLTARRRSSITAEPKQPSPQLNMSATVNTDNTLMLIASIQENMKEFKASIKLKLFNML